MTDGERYAILASIYEPNETRYLSNGQGQQKILNADPRRIYVEFRAYAGASYPKVYPRAIPAGAAAGDVDTAARIYKLHDSPGLVVCEWYILSSDVAAVLDVITDTYVGD